MDALAIIATTYIEGRTESSGHIHARAIVTALHAAGIDLVHRDENHGPTLERAAKVLDVREQTELVVGERHKCGGRHYKAREAFHVARIARSDAAAIRALQDQEGRDG